MHERSFSVGQLSDPAEQIDLGPEHPTRAGLVRLRTELDDDQVVTSARLQPGLSHRGAEKLLEVRDYRQVLMLADRHDWQAPFIGELGVALACEELLGLTAPPRARVVRTLLAELARIHSHLGFVSYVGFALTDTDLSGAIRQARDAVRELMLSLTGNRLHPMAGRLGGLATDPDEAWLRRCVAVAQRAADAARSVRAQIPEPTGVGLVDGALIDQYGLSGPVVRAAGIGHDLRRLPGPLAWADLDWPEPDWQPRADAWGRLDRLAVEIEESAALVGQLADLTAATPGPIGVKLSKIIKLPDAETWLSLEAPWGVAGFHLVSRGGTTVWRLKLRTPTFANVSSLERLLVGTHVDDLALVIASMGWTIGDLDK